MSELVISAEGFTIQPLVDLRDGPCEIRWWYSRSFLESGGVQVNWGTGTTGFWITTPCSIADGLISIDLDTTLWTTDNAQDPSPASIFLSAALYTARGKLIQQLTIANKAQWVVPSSLAPTTTWADFSAYNSAVFIANPPPVFYTAPQVDALVDRAFDQHPASDVELGTVYTSVPPDIASQPVAWITDDPLVRDAVKIQGTDVDDTPPLDTQTLIYNQATNQIEWGNQNPGTGNVTSNEVTSVDGEGAVFSGTGGKTIRRLTGSGFVIAASGQLVPTSAAVATALLDNVVGDSGSGGTKGLAPAPAAGDAAAGKFLKADGTYAVPSGTGAPTDATYITQTPNGGLSAEQALSALSTGLMRVATTTGVITSINDSAGLAANISDETGSGALVFATSPALTTPNIGTPSAGTLTSCTGLPIASGVSGLGAGVATFLATPSSANLASALTDETGSGAAVFATSPALTTPNIGTPSAGTLTNCTGLPIASGVSGLGSNVATFLATPSSANLAAALTDETGSGANVFGTSPTITTPTITSPQVSLTAAHGSDDTYTGTTITGLNAGATIAQWEAVYLDGSSTWQLADANGANTYPARGLAVAAYVSTNPATILVHGTVRNDAWNWTPGGTIYLSGTPGALTQTAPSTSGDKVQQVGFALTADIAFFDFNSTFLTVA